MKLNKNIRIHSGLKKVLLGFLSIFFSLIITNQAWSFDSFVIKSIRVNGLQRIQLSTVLNYLPVKSGQLLDQRKTAEVVHQLYETGFFSDINLARQDSTLIINVIERSTIASITVTGNDDIPKDKLNEGLKKLGLVEGLVYNHSVLERVQEDLKTQYNNIGKYNAKINTKVVPLTRNRVAITITISEGSNAKIRRIKIIGAHAFSESTLRKQFLLTTPTIISYFTGSDQYSKERLDASLEAVRNYYMDRGYLKVAITSTQVSITPDHRDVYITVSISEGALYTFKGFDLSGEFVVPKSDLEKLVLFKPGDVFSRKAVTDTVELFSDALGELGYGLPQITANPVIDDKAKQIFIGFVIHPGHQVYVRRINIAGNTTTADYVFRHAIRQQEGSLLSSSQIKESERQLRVTGFFKDVRVKAQPVVGAPDQVDLNYEVEEKQTSKITVGGGYGTNGFVFNAGIDQPNFLGTGKSLGFNFNTDDLGRYYSVNYFNPYATASGVGRGFEIYFQQAKQGQKKEITNFSADRFGGMLNYSIPLSDRAAFAWGIGYDHYQIQTLPTHIDPESGQLVQDASTQVQQFVSQNGRVFNHIRLTGGFSYNSYDRYDFPTRGLHSQLSAVLNLPGGQSHNLSYYKINYQAHYLHPIAHGFIFSAIGNFGFGASFNKNKGLPFYENYYAGGTAPGEIRGYQSYAVGPHDSNYDPLGGNALVNGSLGIILPYPISRDTIQTTVFVDAGNVYQVNIPQQFQGTYPGGPLRYSLGIAVVWHSPFGAIELSVAQPLNKFCLPTSVFGKKRCDKSDTPQFNISSGF